MRGLGADLLCKAKVGNLDLLWPVAQEVLWLEVTVKEAMLVHVGQPLQHLVHDVTDHRLREELGPSSGETHTSVTDVLAHYIQVQHNTAQHSSPYTRSLVQQSYAILQ